MPLKRSEEHASLVLLHLQLRLLPDLLRNLSNLLPNFVSILGILVSVKWRIVLTSTLPRNSMLPLSPGVRLSHGMERNPKPLLPAEEGLLIALPEVRDVMLAHKVSLDLRAEIGLKVVTGHRVEADQGVATDLIVDPALILRRKVSRSEVSLHLVRKIVDCVSSFRVEIAARAKVVIFGTQVLALTLRKGIADSGSDVCLFMMKVDQLMWLGILPLVAISQGGEEGRAVVRSARAALRSI